MIPALILLAVVVIGIIGSRKFFGGVLSDAKPLPPSHSNESEEERRARHWALIGARVTGAHVIEASRYHP